MKIDLTGIRYGKLVAISQVGVSPKSRKAIWLFQCDCGKQKAIVGEAVRRGNSRSCGCGIVAAVIERNYKHGMSRKAEHGVWRDMKMRCSNPKKTGFKNYGGRGISVCERWEDSFENFWADMGARPSKHHSIERINNHGDYEPGNCRWAVKKEQCRNKRNNHFLKVRGESKTIAEWSEITGLNPRTIETRIRRQGWSDEEAVSK